MSVEMKLGDLVTLQRGTTYKSAMLDLPGPVLLGLASIGRNGGFRSDNLKTYGGPSPEKLLVRPGEVYVSLKDVTQSADLLGAVARVPASVGVGRLTQDTVKLVPRENTLSLAYLYWLLRTPQYREYCRAHATGTTNLGLPREDFLSFLVPPLTSDRSVLVELLEILEKKIELNRRANETLEAMAQAIFRDWFVNFGPTRRKSDGASDPLTIMGGLVTDPDRAQVLANLFPDRFGDTRLPKGWERSALGDHFDVTMGQSPPGSTYNEIGEGLPFFQGRRDFQFRFPSKRVYCTAPTRIAEVDWTLLSVRAPVGDINRAGERCCIGRGVAALIHKAGLSSFTFYTAIHLKEELASYDSNGTVFGSINQKQLRGLAVVGADQQAAETFDQLARPIDKLIRGRTREIEALVATRDLLLPKLMSGEIRIRDAEKLAEDAA